MNCLVKFRRMTVIRSYADAIRVQGSCTSAPDARPAP
jgi:hypothetical protein